MVKLAKTKLEILEESPFYDNLQIDVIEVVEEWEVKPPGNKGIIEGSLKIPRTYTFEADERVSIYKKVDYINTLLVEATPSTLKVFLYIVYNLSKDVDYITIKLSTVSVYLQISIPTLRSALLELNEFNVVARKSQSEYWVNPAYLFNGNRKEYLQSSGRENNINVRHTMRKK